MLLSTISKISPNKQILKPFIFKDLIPTIPVFNLFNGPYIMHSHDVCSGVYFKYLFLLFSSLNYIGNVCYFLKPEYIIIWSLDFNKLGYYLCLISLTFI